MMRMTGVAYCTCSHVGLVMHRVLGLMQQRDQGHASTATAGSHTTRQRKGFAALSLSCVSAAAAETATYPIDAVKTQLQLQRSNIRSSNSSSTKPPGAYQLARRLLHTHGVSGLYAGLSPAVLRHFFYTGTRITLYEQLKASYAEYQAEQAIRTANSSNSSNDLLPKLLFGLTAGAFGQLVAVPADLIKVQMQADVRAVMSGRQQQRQFTSIHSVASALVRQQGLSGLWRGGLPAVQRAALVNLGELSTYDSAKQAISAAALLPAGLPTHLAASVCSGFVSAVISTPADVIKTRLMAQAVEGPGPQQRSQERPSAAAAGSATPGAFKTTSTRRYSSPARQGLCAESARAGAAARPAVQAGAHQAVQLAVQHAAWPASSSVKGAAVTPGALAPPRAVLHVVRSSMSSQHGGSGPFRHSTPQHYTGMVDCAVQIVKQEGLLALYQGFWPTWARLGPWQLVFWVTHEQLRSLANISAF